MTREDYERFKADFTEGVARLEDEGLSFFSTGASKACMTCLLSGNTGPAFSTTPCNICGRHWPGDRHPAHVVDSEGELRHLEVCEDCCYFHEYGQLDDQTMLDMDRGAHS